MNSTKRSRNKIQFRPIEKKDSRFILKTTKPALSHSELSAGFALNKDFMQLSVWFNAVINMKSNL